MLASDVNNPAFVGPTDPNAGLSVWFRSKPIQSPFKTALQGRPIFEDVIYIHIESAGDTETIIERPKYESDEQRFPVQWAAYMNAHSNDPKLIGTPLEQWPIISASQAEELKALKFRTIEQVATCSDSALQVIGTIAGMAPHAFRARAQAFLAAAQNAALVENQAVALKEAQEREAKTQEELNALKEQVARLTDISMAPEQKRRG